MRASCAHLARMDKPDSIQMSVTGAFAKPAHTATPIHDPRGTTLAQHSQRIARKISNRMEQEPLARRISVVVLTYNRADELITTLQRLLALPERPPIFVVDNASDDSTVAGVKALFPSVRIIECEHNL